MNRRDILAAFKSDDDSMHIKALQVLIEGKDLNDNCFIDLGNGFSIDNNLVPYNGDIFNDIDIYFLGNKIKSMMIQNRGLLIE